MKILRCQAVRSRIPSRLLTLFAITASIACHIAEAQEPVNIAKLVESGKATADKLEKVTAIWTNAFELPNGFEAKVDNLKVDNARLMRLSLVKGEMSSVLSTVVERDGLWFVKQGNVRGKYRPYEAPFDFPAGYLFLAKSQPVAVTDERVSAIGTFKNWEGKTAVFVAEIPEHARKQLQDAVDAMASLVNERGAPPTLRETMERNKRILKNGVELKIDSELGLIVQNGAEGNRYWTREFQLDPPKGVSSIEVDPEGWTDFTDEIVTEETRSEIIMAMHEPLWKPGQRGTDGDMVLLNIKNGAIRRIPVPVAGGPGCFSSDAKFVYLSSLDIRIGSMIVVEVELKTGFSRALGNPELQTGVCMFPTLSPDGRTLAVLHKASAASGLASQIHLIDIESGASRKIGEPLDTGPVAWLPNGSGLVVNRRESVEASKPSLGHICIMSLDGALEPIIDGDAAVVLEQSSRILFCENGRKFWKTCDLDGGGVKDFGDGFKSFAFPAPSRDGKRLIMMKYDSRVGPKPHVVDLQTEVSTPIPIDDGLWSNISWR